MARARLHTELLSLDSPKLSRLLAGRNPLGRSLSLLGSMRDLIVAGANTISAIASIYFFAIRLPDQLTLRVLLVTINVIVRWNGGWIWHQGVRRLFVPGAALAVLLLAPLTALVVLAWPWVACRLRVHHVVLKALCLRSKRVLWLHQLDSKLVKAELLQGFGALHSFVDLVKSVRCRVSSGPFIKQIEM